MAESQNPSTKALPVWTPEVQAGLDKFHQEIGQALVDNLNRNVLAQDQADQSAPQQPSSQQSARNGLA